MPAPARDYTLRFEHGFFSNTVSKRFVAWIIDTAVIGVLVALILPMTLFTGLFFLPFLFLVIGLAYRWVSVARWSATPGMWMLGIEFRTVQGHRLDNATAFMHALGYTVSVTLFLPQLLSIAMMLSTERHTGLSDAILGTFAINRPISP